jgi:hypothetical protein
MSRLQRRSRAMGQTNAPNDQRTTIIEQPSSNGHRTSIIDNHHFT